jgi:S1-C subfamily serine protease
VRAVLTVSLALAAGLAGGYLGARLAPRPEPPPPPPVTDLAALYVQSAPSVVSVRTDQALRRLFRSGESRGVGSGFVVDDGLIVTSRHVIAQANRIVVEFHGGWTGSAELVAGDELSDLALLRVPGSPQVAPLELAAADPAIGSLALAIGNPFGEFPGSVSVGHVSALHRRVPAPGGGVIAGMIQTDAALNPGNSGGPLLDSSGRVIGVNTAIFGPDGVSIGLGFAVSSPVAATVIEALRTQGRVPRPQSGLTEFKTLRDWAGLGGYPDGEGVIVLAVQRGSPAERAGVRGSSGEERWGQTLVLTGGDVILAVNGRAVTSADALIAELAILRGGETATLVLLRGGVPTTVALALE